MNSIFYPRIQFQGSHISQPFYHKMTTTYAICNKSITYSSSNEKKNQLPDSSKPENHSVTIYNISVKDSLITNVHLFVSVVVFRGKSEEPVQ